MTITSFFAMFFMGGMGLYNQFALREMMGSETFTSLISTLLYILGFTFVIEAFGALGLWFSIHSTLNMSLHDEIFFSVFHSVSAFCNAGFDLMGESAEFSSLTKYVYNPAVNIIIMTLIIVGGIGFLTWDDIKTNKWHLRRYRMQSKVIIFTTAILIIVPALYFFFFEFSDLTLGKRVLVSLFQSVTPRTAGFNTVDASELSETGNVVVTTLMLIGGAPGSTAGGMKVTTFAVLLATTVAVFAKQDDAHIFARRIGNAIVKNAATILLMYVSLFTLGAMIISSIEGLPITQCFYETASAIGTVGLTTGITPTLGSVSKIILIFLMYMGRAGVLTIVFATKNNVQKNVVKYPLETITVG